MARRTQKRRRLISKWWSLVLPAIILMHEQRNWTWQRYHSIVFAGVATRPGKLEPLYVGGVIVWFSE